MKIAFLRDLMKDIDPNTETTLLADLDLGLLKELREHGSVRNFRQKRRDLYSLKWVGRSQEENEDRFEQTAS